jgi:hypothetical protein
LNFLMVPWESLEHLVDKMQRTASAWKIWFMRKPLFRLVHSRSSLPRVSFSSTFLCQTRMVLCL